jgi:hypothetical protein
MTSGFMVLSLCKEYYQFLLVEGVILGTGLSLMYDSSCILIQISNCSIMSQHLVSQETGIGDGYYVFWILSWRSLLPIHA